jgi:hypothetical protein
MIRTYASMHRRSSVGTARGTIRIVAGTMILDMPYRESSTLAANGARSDRRIQPDEFELVRSPARALRSEGTELLRQFHPIVGCNRAPRIRY